MKIQPADFGKRSPADAAQMCRALDLLEVARSTPNPNVRFAIEVGALHLARSIPEHWFTFAEQVPLDRHMTGIKAKQLARDLREQIEGEFQKARRYELLTELRSWDYHWEPLYNPETLGINETRGRGAPVRLTTGKSPNSSVAFMPALPPTSRVIATGSGRQVGRKNYYRIEKRRFTDFARSELLPLHLAIREFIEDLPQCIIAIRELPEIAAEVCRSTDIAKSAGDADSVESSPEQSQGAAEESDS